MDNNTEKKIALTIGGGVYLVSAAEVIGVTFVQRSAIWNVPFDQSGRVRGIFSYKGSVTALVSRQGMTAGSDAHGSENLTAAVLRFEDESFGILVDSADAADSASLSSAVTITARQLYYGEKFNDD